MSIFSDDRRYSDDEEEYTQWENELRRECAREEYANDPKNRPYVSDVWEDSGEEM